LEAKAEHKSVYDMGFPGYGASQALWFLSSESAAERAQATQGQSSEQGTQRIEWRAGMFTIPGF
jgi:hypothetical protein